MNHRWQIYGDSQCNPKNNTGIRVAVGISNTKLVILLHEYLFITYFISFVYCGNPARRVNHLVPTRTQTGVYSKPKRHFKSNISISDLKEQTDNWRDPQPSSAGWHHHSHTCRYLLTPKPRDAPWSRLFMVCSPLALHWPSGALHQVDWQGPGCHNMHCVTVCCDLL